MSSIFLFYITLTYIAKYDKIYSVILRIEKGEAMEESDGELKESGEMRVDIQNCDNESALAIIKNSAYKVYTVSIGVYMGSKEVEIKIHHLGHQLIRREIISDEITSCSAGLQFALMYMYSLGEKITSVTFINFLISNGQWQYIVITEKPNQEAK